MNFLPIVISVLSRGFSPPFARGLLGSCLISSPQRKQLYRTRRTFVLSRNNFAMEVLIKPLDYLRICGWVPVAMLLMQPQKLDQLTGNGQISLGALSIGNFCPLEKSRAAFKVSRLPPAASHILNISFTLSGRVTRRTLHLGNLRRRPLAIVLTRVILCKRCQVHISLNKRYLTWKWWTWRPLCCSDQRRKGCLKANQRWRQRAFC